MSEQAIKIDKNVPLPERSSFPPLPLEKMEVGDSFVLAVSGERENDTIRQRLIRYQKANLPVQFSMLKIDDDSVRIHRVEDNK